MRSEKAMDIFSLKLHAEESQKIEVVLSSILKNFESASAVLVSRTGQEIAFCGPDDSIDRDALASLAAGNLAAISGLAQIIGENEFERVFHQGRKRSVLIVPVGRLALLVLVLPNEGASKQGIKQLGRSLMLLKDLLEKRNT